MIFRADKIQHYFYGIWYSQEKKPSYLKPLSLMFQLVTASNRWLYRQGFRHQYQPPVPLIVVGNIHVGGGGKSPMVSALYQYAKDQGLNPGIVSRGYLREGVGVQIVAAGTSASQVGDEPKMLYDQTKAPIAVHSDRVKAVRTLLMAYPDIDLIFSDDGLQHYALGRDVEILMLPAEEKLRNQSLMPLGPLREPMARKHTVDFVFQLDKAYELQQPRHIKTGKPLEPWPYKGAQVHAVAGIAHPDNFFNGLDALLGVQINRHAFNDHYAYQEVDFNFDRGDQPILMTEKDAVKCQAFAREHWYSVPLAVKLPAAIKQNIIETAFNKAKARGLR